MHITQAARILRPGTSWNWDGKTLTQAEDGTPRVSVPTDKELEPLLAQPDPDDVLRQQAKIDLNTSSKTDTERINAIIKYLGLDR